MFDPNYINLKVFVLKQVSKDILKDLCVDGKIFSCFLLL